MRKRLLVRAGLVLAVVLLLVGAALFRSVSHRLARNARIDWDNFDRIQKGMTRQEVEAILGGPPGHFTTRRMLFFSSGLGPNPRGYHWEAWDGDRGRIEVEFDAADVVVVKYFAEGVSAPALSPAERLRDWLVRLWL